MARKVMQFIPKWLICRDNLDYVYKKKSQNLAVLQQSIFLEMQIIQQDAVCLLTVKLYSVKMVYNNYHLLLGLVA